MTDARRTKDARPGSRPIDGVVLPSRRLERAPGRLSIIRRSSDQAADMGEWIIDELDDRPEPSRSAPLR